MPTSSKPEGSAAPQQKDKKQKVKQGGQKDEHKSMAALPWTPIVQGQVSRLPLVFTPDAQFFFVVVLSSVKIFSRATGQLVSTLSNAASTSSHTSWSKRQICESHTGPITGLCLNPANSLQLLTCSLDGTIKVWDYLDAVLLRTIDVAFPVSHMAAHHSIKGSVYVALKKPKNSGPASASPPDPFDHNGRFNSIIQLVSLSTVSNKGAGATKSQSVTRVGKARQTTSMALSSNGKYLILIGKRKIHVAQLEALKDGFTKIITDQELTCLAIHPETNTFATGDAVGQIRLWYFLDGSQAQRNQKAGKGVQVAPSVLLHWHAHAVSALAFTQNGASLISGGEESVMVLWQLANQAKEFVPRLGGATIESVCALSGDQGREAEYVASLADGNIAFIGAINLKVSRTISQFLIDSTRRILGQDYYATDTTFPLAVQPGTGHLVVTAGHPSTLQFYDVESETLVSQMEIILSNRVSRPDEIPMEPSRVETVCFSRAGDLMATVDSRGTHGEASLKIWQWDAKQKSFKLASRLDNPHDGARVTCISFCPTEGAAGMSSGSSSQSPLLLSVGADNKARTWRKITQTTKGARKEEFWVARSVFDYRNLPTKSAAWEPNGSLLALMHDDFVSIWEPITNSLVRVVSVKGQGKGVTFAGKGGRYIVVLTDQTLLVWDIVLGQETWESETRASHLLNSGELNFCVLSKRQGRSTIVSTLSPLSSTPLSQHQLNISLRQVGGADSGGSPTVPSFYGLTRDFDVVRIGASPAAEAALPGHFPQAIRGVPVKRRTMLDDLIGIREMPASQQQEELPVRPLNRSIVSRGGVGKGLLDVASHLLPPMSVLYEPLMEQILPKMRAEMVKPAEARGGDDNSKGDAIINDEQSEEEDEEDSEIETQTAGGIERLRQVSKMDMSSISALFAQQAVVSSASEAATSTPKANGKGINGKGTNGTKLNGHAALTSTSPAVKTTDKSTEAPTLSPRVGAARSKAKATTMTTTVTTLAASSNGHAAEATPFSSGRKRKQQPLVD